MSHGTSLKGSQSVVQCYCLTGFYFALSGCHACPKGATCRGGLALDTMERLLDDRAFTEIPTSVHAKPQAVQGYYLDKVHPHLEAPGDWEFVQCPVIGACLGEDQCGPTMEGFLCAECKKGNTNAFKASELCSACPEQTWNLIALVLYYLLTIAFNIVMTYMNVAAGFNRRSIHSIVIKVASNYITCMSVLGVVKLSSIHLPSTIENLKTDVTEAKSVKRPHILSVDCLIRNNFNLSHSESFFYTNVVFFCLPVVLPVVVSAIMLVVLQAVKAWRMRSDSRKLALLKQVKGYGLETLYNQLKEEYENRRFLMMFRYRYVTRPSIWHQFGRFIEDMIPIYVTVLFFLHTSTTRSMLGLLNCYHIPYGNGLLQESRLSSATSIQCDIGLNTEYTKFFILGVSGFLLWGVGIPLAAFIILFCHRSELHTKEMRMKFGFLHNGFTSKFWFWETVVFTRKLAVLVVSSISFRYSEQGSGDSSGASLWAAASIAAFFLIIHLRSQPFDERCVSFSIPVERHDELAARKRPVWKSRVLGFDCNRARFKAAKNHQTCLLGLPVLFTSRSF